MILHRNPSALGRRGYDTVLDRGRPERFGPSFRVRADQGITVATGVSQWNDLSGNGRNLTQGTGAAQPLFVASATNGKPAVRFDGTDDLLATGAYTRNQPVTVVLSYKSVTITVAHDYIFSGLTDDTLAFISDATPQHYMYSGASGVLKAGSLADGVYARVRCVFNTTSSSVAANGSEEDTGNVGASNGSGIRIGGLASSRWANFELAELVEYQRVLSTSELMRLEGYLRAWFGTA